MKKIVFTTSRRPSNKTRSFIKDIVSVIPNSSKYARGTQSLDYLLNLLKNRGFQIAVVINSVKGNPNFWRIFDLSGESPVEFSYAIKLRGLTLSREYTSKRASQPQFGILISSLHNEEEENVLKLIFNIEEKEVNDVEHKRFVTAYADYIDEEMIFIEFLDQNNNPVGPRMKLKVITREISDNELSRDD
ncbi:MAG: hypothetical protein ACTSQE_00110 [Candidatus Heimdallarchaeaceae archaeon]